MPDRRQQAALRAAVGEFIHARADWSWYVHLTFDLPVPDAVGARVFRTWSQRVAATIAARHFWLAWGTEQQRRGVVHFHALLALPDYLNGFGRTGDRLWKQAHRQAGFTSIVRFDWGQGAAWYISKGGDWNINVACDRRRRCRRSGAGCREAPGPW